jgi:hypothetical protein
MLIYVMMKKKKEARAVDTNLQCLFAGVVKAW